MYKRDMMISQETCRHNSESLQNALISGVLIDLVLLPARGIQAALQRPARPAPVLPVAKEDSNRRVPVTGAKKLPKPSEGQG